MADVEVLGVGFSYFVRSVCMALEEKSVPYTLIVCGPHTPEIDAIHPLGKMPCLRHGDFSVCESKAICTYVDQTFPGPKLIPQEPKAAAVVEQWVSIVNSALMPVFQAYMASYFFPRTADCEPDPNAIAVATGPANDYLKLLDRAVGATGYLAGDSFSLADIAVLPMLAYLADLPETGHTFKETSALAAYLDKHAKRPSFVKTAPPPSAELMLTTRAIMRERMAQAATPR